MIGQQGWRRGRVTADDQLQAVRGLSDERNDQTAVKVPGPNMVDLARGRGEVSKARLNGASLD